MQERRCLGILHGLVLCLGILYGPRLYLRILMPPNLRFVNVPDPCLRIFYRTDPPVLMGWPRRDVDDLRWGILRGLYGLNLCPCIFDPSILLGRPSLELPQQDSR